MAEYAEVFPVHRTTYGHLLSKKWKEEQVAEIQKRESLQTIAKLAEAKQSSSFISIDDAVITKTKRSTEGTDWHYFHLGR